MELERRLADVESRLDEALLRERALQDEVRASEAGRHDAMGSAERDRIELEKARVKLDQAQGELSARTSEAAELRSSLFQLQEVIGNEVRERERLLELCGRRATELAEWERTHAAVSSALGDARADADRLRADLSEKSGEIAALHELTKLQREEAAAKQDELKQCYYREAELAAKLDEQSAALDDLRRAAAQRERELRASRAALKDADAELQTERKAKHDAEGALHLAYADVASLTSARNALARRLKEREHELGETRALFEARSGEIAGLRERTAQVSSKARDQQRAKDKAREEIEALERMVRERDEVIAAMRVEQRPGDAGKGKMIVDERFRALERHHAILQDKYDRLLATIAPLLNEQAEPLGGAF